MTPQEQKSQELIELKSILAVHFLNMLMLCVNDLEPIPEALLKYLNSADDPHKETQDYFENEHQIDPVLIQLAGKHYVLDRNILKENKAIKIVI